jgi:hypothetical protein
MNRYSLIRALGVLVLATLAACDGSAAPTGVIGTPPSPVTEKPNHVPSPSLYGDSVYTVAILTCNATRSPATIACTSPQGTGVGGKGTHVQPLTDSVRYEAGIFHFRMRFRNLLVNRMGTADGATTDGIMAFITAPPTRTGTGTVTVNNADSTGTFSAANQPYFFYDTIVGMNEETMWRRWRFNVPSTVTTFQFKVYIAAPLLPFLVFDQEIAGNRDIWRVNLDGTDLVQLTTDAKVDLDPTVANGKLVWVSYRFGNAEMLSQNVSGLGGESRLTNSLANETAPALSLDGTRLAYVSDANGAGKIWIGTFGGTTLSNAAPVTGSLENVIENGPTWERSSRILYVSTQGATSDMYHFTPGDAVPVRFGVSSTTAADVEPAISHREIPAAGVLRTLWATNRDAGDTEVYSRHGTTTIRQTTRVGVDAQPTFLSDYKMLWVEEGSPTILRWKSSTSAATGTVPYGGVGSARNPYGVPLYQ